MSCCAVSFHTDAPTDARGEELRLASHPLEAGYRQSDISVPTIHCGACIRAIETGLGKLPGVEYARVNLSTKRVAVRWSGEPPPLLQTLETLGYEANLGDSQADRTDGQLRQLILALAVAGFAAMNIMMLSIAVWAGAEPAVRDIFHGISAFIAVPAFVYSGRIFFVSAWNAVRHARTNMDVPISLGVLLAFGLSLYETFWHGTHAYFDAAAMLLFFLLIGRTLDHMMRERARAAVKGLERLAARGAMVIAPDGARTYLPLAEIEPGMSILLAAGERVPVNAVVSWGRSEIDCSLVTGESVPQPAGEGTLLQAGTLNLTGPLMIVATSASSQSLLAEMLRMMEAAEAGRSVYRRIADRAARLYAPVVHLAALLTFIGWMLIDGDFHRAITIAIAVLIITCPCALGLAVPMVQVAAARRLFEGGIMVKDGGALERIAEIDTVFFDKTGTLTLGRPRLIGAETFDAEVLAIAAAIASHSGHPYSVALAAAKPESAEAFDSIREHPGLGLEASAGSAVFRLGRPDWVVMANPTELAGRADVALARDGELLAVFRFEDRLREGAPEAVQMLRDIGLSVETLSGDSEEAVKSVAKTLVIRHASRASPADKVNHIAAATVTGRKVLMVGDGLNDAPALAAAYASMAPASAADVGRNAADLVFLRESLMAVPQAIATARRAKRLIRQNFALAIIYNVFAVPIAIAGEVTPLIAAVAMSLSSILVVANSIRFRGFASAGAPVRRPPIAEQVQTVRRAA